MIRELRESPIEQAKASGCPSMQMRARAAVQRTGLRDSPGSSGLQAGSSGNCLDSTEKVRSGTVVLRRARVSCRFAQ